MVKRPTTKTREGRKLWDWVLQLSYRSHNWQPHRNYCCWRACELVLRYETHKNRSLGIESSWCKTSFVLVNGSYIPTQRYLSCVVYGVAIDGMFKSNKIRQIAPGASRFRCTVKYLNEVLQEIMWQHTFIDNILFNIDAKMNAFHKRVLICLFE